MNVHVDNVQMLNIDPTHTHKQEQKRSQTKLFKYNSLHQ